MLPCNGLDLGPGEVGQGGPKVLYLWRHSKKIRTLQPKNFFRVQTRRLAESFEPLNSSLPIFGARVTLTQSHMQSVFFARNPLLAGRESVKLLKAFES